MPMSDAPDTRPASRAVAILCRQFIERVQAERAELGAIAFEADKPDPAEWLLDIDRACYVRKPSPDTPAG